MRRSWVKRRENCGRSYDATNFPRTTAGNMAQQYLHRARMFREAAVRLPDISNGEQFWPRYALLTHAIELSLKAFYYLQSSLGRRLAESQSSMTCLDGITLRFRMDFNKSRALRTISIS